MRSLRRPARPGAALTLSLLVGGCAGTLEIPDGSPYRGTSLTPYDGAVRTYLLDEDARGLAAIRSDRSADEVVRLMSEGLLAHRLGLWEESNRALQRAERIATDRYTKSLTQELASLVVSDNVVDYEASALERSMIHYYGMFNYLALGDPESALVEARRANALIRRYGNDHPGRSFVNDASVQYLAGMLQWGEREDNDAVVSLRQSLAGYETYAKDYGVRAPRAVAEDVVRVAAAVGLDDVAERTSADLLGDAAAEDRPLGPDEGDVIIVVENGFIAHKRQQKLFVPITKAERDSVTAGSAGAAIEAAVRVLVRTAIVMNDLSREGQDYVQAHEDGVAFVSGALSAVGLELVTMAWPVYELQSGRATAIRVTPAGGSGVVPVVMEDLSAIAVRDFEERKTGMLLRMVARTLLKEAAIVEGEKAGERAGGALGGFAARVAARTLANATERADTRSWAGLPAELLLARLRLPAGTHEIEVAYQGMNGPETRTLTVDVEAGGVAMRTVSVLGRDGGDGGRFRQALRRVDYRVPAGSSDRRRR